jgi:hypothetical protein
MTKLRKSLKVIKIQILKSFFKPANYMVDADDAHGYIFNNFIE